MVITTVFLVFAFLCGPSESSDQEFWVDMVRSAQATTHEDGSAIGTGDMDTLLTLGVDVNGTTDTYYKWNIEVKAVGFFDFVAVVTEIGPNSTLDFAMCELPIPLSNACPCSWYNFNQTCFKLIFLNGSDMASAAAACPKEAKKAFLARSFALIYQNRITAKNMYPYACGGPWYMVLADGTGNSGTFCFKMMPQKMDWISAEKECQKIVVDGVQSHLASFTSQSHSHCWNDFLDPQFVTNFLCMNNKSSETEFWVGLNDYADQNRVTYANAYMPDDLFSDLVTGAPNKKSGDCIYWDTTDNLWHRRACGDQLNFFCQAGGRSEGPCAKGWVWLSPLCYKFLPTQMTFDQGNRACQNLGGSMISFHATYTWEQFQNYSTGLINLLEVGGNKIYEDMFIGMNCTNGDYTNQASYKFLDGSGQWGFWDSPSNMQSSGGCVVTSRAANNHYAWRNGDCNQPRGIVCQNWPSRKGTKCPNGWDSVGDGGEQNCFQYQVTPPLFWPEAQKLCHRLGAVLPVIYTRGFLGGGNLDQRWPNFIEWRASQPYPNDRIWMGWSKYADGTWVANNLFRPVLAGLFWGPTSMKNQDYAISINGVADYLMVTDTVTATANVICMTGNNTCSNYSLYYQTSSGVCYFTDETVRNFVDADLYCQANGARLATFDKQSNWDDFDMLRKVLVNILYPKTAWIGYNRGPIYGPNTSPFLNIHYGRKSTDLGHGGWKPWDTNEPSNTINNQSYCAALTGKYGEKIMDDLCTSPLGTLCLAPNDYNAGYKPYTGNGLDPFMYYAINNGTPMSFQQAKSQCQAAGGQLPAFHSAAEWDDFLRYRWVKRDTGFPLQMQTVWLGLQRNSSTTIHWSWEKSAASNYNWTNWSQGHPTASSNQLCAMSDSTLGSDDMPWRSVDCNGMYSAICQIRNTTIKNTCKPGFVNLDKYNRCLIPLTNYTSLPRETAAAVCDAYGLSLPSFDQSSSWTAVKNWVTNINTAARFTINDTAWPITNFWLGVQNLDDTADNWHYDDTKTNYNASEWNLPSSPAGADCVITRDQSSFNWTTVNCQQTNATNLLCQDVPTNKTCPAKFRQASPTMCYQLSTPSTATSYQQALSQCQAMNATLPSFHNYSEWKDFLKQKGFVDAIQGYPLLEPGFWIGLKDVTGNGTWVWADKSNYDWNYWTVGTEPKQAGACVVADFKMPEFTWRTEPCMSTVTFAVMCQLRLVPQTNICPDRWAQVGGHCYQLLNQASAISAEQGSLDCSSVGGILPSFDSLQHYQDFLAWKSNLARMNGMVSTDFFTGLNTTVPNVFNWRNGTELDWNSTAPAPWASGQPGTIVPACVVAVAQTNYSWSTVNCSQPTSNLICEYAPSNDTCPPTWKQIGDICYKPADKFATATGAVFAFGQAQQLCATEGGNLPSFHSLAEWTDFNLMRRYFSFVKNSTVPTVWLGLNDTNQNFVWQWSDESNYNWTFWKVGTEPKIGSGLDCVASPALATSTDDGPWASMDCSTQNAALCQKRKTPLTNRCKPGFAYLSDNARCFVPLGNYTNLPRDIADAVCDALNLSLPSFANQTGWTAFTAWIKNTNLAAHWSTNDSAWPISTFWIGLSYANQTSSWRYDDNGTTYSSAEFPMASAGSGAGCVISKPSIGFNWTNVDCSSMNATSLICQDVPKTKTCPGSYRDATPTVCYLQTGPAASTYDQALSQCQAVGGTLPSFHNTSEWNDFIHQKAIVDAIQGFPIREAGIWIGLKDSIGDGTWVWEDGTNFDWNYWTIGTEPNPGFGCVIADLKQVDMAWKTASCTPSASYATICQLRLEYPPNVCPVGWAQIEGHCYKLLHQIPFPVDKQQAELDCSSVDGVLPSFDSVKNYQSFLAWKSNVARGKDMATTDFYTGLSQASANTFQWPNKTAMNWSSTAPWAAGQPAAIPNSCVAAQEASNYSWAAVPCTQRMPSLFCELGVVTNNCTAGWKQIGEICYMLANATLNTTMQEADAACQQESGNLPSFHTLKEWEDFNVMRRYFALETDSATIGPVWIGLNDTSQDFLRLWRDSSNYNWTYWNPRVEPSKGAGLDCVESQALATSSDTGPWKTTECNKRNAFLCQQRFLNLTNPCRPGFAYLENGTRCFVPMTNYSNLPQDMADAICDYYGLSLPSFENRSAWTSFEDWVTNADNAARWTANDTIWPITNFWIGLQYDPTPKEWQYSDNQTAYSLMEFPFESAPTQPSCALSNISAGSNWTLADCMQTNASSLICQDVPRRKTCPGSFRQASPTVCYLQAAPSAVTYDQAQTQCEAIGGTLPSFHNMSEWTAFIRQKAITEAIQGFPIREAGIWIGLRDNVGDGTWVWEDGTNFDWNYWTIAVEPRPGYGCVVADLALADMTWKTESCTPATSYALICQLRLVYPPNACPDGWAQISGHCYKLLNQIPFPVDSEQGALDCSSVEGALPSFSSLENFQDFLLWKDNLARGKDMNTTDFFTGLTQASVNPLVYLWPNQTLLDWNPPWVAGQPGNLAPTCVIAASATNYTWSTVPCTDKAKSLFCEWGTTEDNCTAGWKQIGDNCYKVPNATITNSSAIFSMEEAEELCLAEGGNVPSFHSEKEWSDFNRMRRFFALSTNRSTLQTVWTGLNDTAQNLIWQWRDGSNYNWTYWKMKSEPAIGVALDCVVSEPLATDADDGPWTTSICDSKRAVVCQQRMTDLGNPCKPGFAYLETCSRCFVILTNYSHLPRDMADAVCDAFGLSLPSFGSSGGWTDFVNWINNSNIAARWSTNDLAWPISSFWIGFQQSAGKSWQTDDNATAYNPTVFPLSSSNDTRCVIGQASSGFNMSAIDCLQYNATNLICQDVPRQKVCPGSFRQASETVCYLQTGPSASTYEQALSQCQAIGGTLPSFHNTSEWTDFIRQKAIVEVIQGYSIRESGIWLGLKDSIGDGTWVWVDGTNFDWNYWTVGVEPKPGYGCAVAGLGQPDMAWKAESCVSAMNYSILCQMRLVMSPNVCPDGWAQLSGHCYKLLNQIPFAVDSEQGALDCSSVQGTLPTYSSLENYQIFLDWKQNLGRGRNMNTTDFFTGLVQTSVSPRVHQWPNQTVMNWSDVAPWALGQPGPDAPGCIVALSANNYTWSTVPCASTVPSLFCELGVIEDNCTAGWKQMGSSCYKAPNVSSGSLEEADKLCMAEGGYVPSFHSLDEWNDFIRIRRFYSLQTNGSTLQTAWIGLNNSMQNFIWQWQDGSNYNWTYWRPNQEPTIGQGRDCVASAPLLSDSDDGPWMSTDCGVKNSIICQQRMNAMTNPCKPGFAYLEQCSRCFIPLSNYTSLSREMADAVCDAHGLSLPSFGTGTGWTAFVEWMNNFNKAARWSFNDLAWPLSDFWIGLKNTGNGTINWQYDDNQTSYSPGVYPLATAPADDDCIISRSSSNNTWTTVGCQQNATNLICQDVPKSKTCPGSFRQATPTVCYLETSNASSSYDETLRQCEDLGATLPSFHNSSEWNDFLKQREIVEVLQGGPIREPGLWIGLKTAATSWWVWEDKTDVDWSYWTAGEPSSGHGCAVSDISKPGLSWKVEDCVSNVSYRAICQLRLVMPPSGTTTTPTASTSTSTTSTMSSTTTTITTTTPTASISTVSTTSLSTSSAETSLPNTTSTSTSTTLTTETSSTTSSSSAPSSSSSTSTLTAETSGTTGTTGSSSATSSSSSMPTSTTATSEATSTTSSSTTSSSSSATTPTTRKTPPAPRDNCTEGWKQMGNNCYKQPNASLIAPVNKTYTMSEAEKACQDEEGELPSFHSLEEWMEVIQMRNHIAKEEGTSKSVWIGLSDPEQLSIWQWHDDSNYNWTYWTSGKEPRTDAGQICAVSPALQNASDSGTWISSTCNSQYGVVCQQRLMPLGDLCPPGWSLIGQRCYRILPQYTWITFDRATEACLDVNATLPSFGSQQQWTQFMGWKDNFARTVGLNTTSFWISALYNATGNSTGWQWGDYVTPWTWTNWLSLPSPENCIYADAYHGYQWNNADCDNTPMANVICQYIDYPVGLKLDSWSDWGPCSASCDYAIQMRNRSATIDTLSIDDQTVGANMSEIRLCKTDYCLYYWPGVGPQFRSASDILALDALTNSVMEYLIVQINDSTRLKAGLELNNIIFDCYYDQRHCDIPGDFEVHLNTKLGNCYTFNFNNVTPKYRVDRTGRIAGLAIWLESFSEESLCQTEAFGFKILIHPQNEYPFPDSLGFNLDTVSVLDIMLLQEQYIRLSQPYGACASDNSLSYLYDGDYSLEGCMRTCYQEAIVAVCGCGDPNYPLPPGAKYCKIDSKPCVDNVYTCLGSEIEEDCNCPMPCQQKLYYRTQSRSQMRRIDWEADCYFRNVRNISACLEEFPRRKFAVMKIYFGNKRQTSYEEQPEMSISDFFADITGIAQLLINLDGVGGFEILLLGAFIILELFKIPFCPNWKFGHVKVEPSHHLRVPGST